MVNIIHRNLILLSVLFLFAQGVKVNGPIEEEEEEDTFSPLDTLAEFDECLLENNVSGAGKTNIQDYRWFARIGISGEYGSRFICGSSLINRQYVITAGHCVQGQRKVDITVRLGEWDTKTNPDCERVGRTQKLCASRVVDVGVSNVYFHDNFRSTVAGHNDVALLRLSKTVDNSEWIKPACLPITDMLKKMKLKNKNMVAIGFGETEEDTESRHLLQVVLPYSEGDDEICTESEIIICAGGQEGYDTCNGDSGGPLMALHKNKYLILLGITSYGGDECGVGQPGAYMRVSYYMDWILEKIKPYSS